MIQSPCKDCSSRSVGCHASCESYINYRNRMDKCIERREESQDLLGTILKLEAQRRNSRLHR